MKKTILISIVLSLGIALTANASSNKQNLQMSLNMAIDDEYKAYTLYEATIEKFGSIRPFSNIINAEARHIESIENLMIQYEIPIPVNPYKKEKMMDLVPATIDEACKIGVQAEIDNAKLYDEKILPLVEGFADAKLVLQNLRDASQLRHLPAFQRCGHGDGKGKGMGYTW